MLLSCINGVIVSLTRRSTASPVLPRTEAGLWAIRIRPRAGRIAEARYKVKLSSQPALVLQALVERPGDLVSREDLRNRLWPGATAGDFEQGLNTCVNKLRQKLGDSANHPRYVETVAGA